MFLPSRWLRSLWSQITVKPRKNLRPRGERFFRPNVEELDGRNPPSNFLASPETINSDDGSAVNIRVEADDRDGNQISFSASDVPSGITFSGGGSGVAQRALASAHSGSTHHGTLTASAADTTVSVTVGDSTPRNFNVLTAPPLDGSYAVRCNGLGGNNQWLAPDGTSGVKLTSTSSTWVFTLLSNSAGNCYTIQCQIDGTAYYLQWANNGNDATNVGLVTEAGDGTTWQLGDDHIKAVSSSNQLAQPNCPFMNGDVSSGTVNMVQLPGENASSWSLGTYP